MKSKLAAAFAAASLLLAAAGSADAEEGRKWVDPPAAIHDETVTYPEIPPSVDEARPAPATAESHEDGDRTETGSLAKPETKKAEAKRPSPKAQPDRKPRQKAASAPERSRKAASRSGGDRTASRKSSRTGPAREANRRDLPPPPREFRTVREALDAGFAVTRIRTYYLPDGRRIEVVTELDPLRPY